MQPRSGSWFTQEMFLTAINLIYKNLFYHQPFNGLLIIMNKNFSANIPSLRPLFLTCIFNLNQK